MSNKQQLLRVGRQTEVRGRFSLREMVDPVHEVADASLAGKDELVTLFLDAGDDVVVFFEGGGREEVVHEYLELLEITGVVDLTAVRLCD